MSDQPKQCVPVEIDTASIETIVAERMKRAADLLFVPGQQLTADVLRRYEDACVMALSDCVEESEARQIVVAVLREKLGPKYDDLCK